MELSSDVKEQLLKLEEVVGGMEGALSPLLSMSLQDLEEMAPLDAAQVQLSLARAVNTLFTIYLKCAGTDPKEHLVQKEAERLQQYSRRIAAAVREQEAATQNRSMAVDIGAANRFIEHAIPELTDDQKRKLRESGKEAEKEHKEAVKGAKKKGKKRSAEKDDAAEEDSSPAPATRKNADEFLAGVLGSAEETPSSSAKKSKKKKKKSVS